MKNNNYYYKRISLNDTQTKKDGVLRIWKTSNGNFSVMLKYTLLHDGEKLIEKVKREINRSEADLLFTDLRKSY